jgi:hypothetical protein
MELHSFAMSHNAHVKSDKEKDMPKVILTAQVEDAKKWEAGFKTHGDVFRTYDLKGPVEYSVVGNEVGLCFDVKDAEKFKSAMQSPETAAAMQFDGVKRDTVKTFVLEKEVKASN